RIPCLFPANDAPAGTRLRSRAISLEARCDARSRGMGAHPTPEGPFSALSCGSDMSTGGEGIAHSLGGVIDPRQHHYASPDFRAFFWARTTPAFKPRLMIF